MINRLITKIQLFWFRFKYEQFNLDRLFEKNQAKMIISKLKNEDRLMVRLEIGKMEYFFDSTQTKKSYETRDGDKGTKTTCCYGGFGKYLGG